MKIVIDIHEEEYNDIKYYGTIVDEDRDYIAECILNGTPLDKIRGEIVPLKDYDKEYAHKKTLEIIDSIER